MRLKKIIAALRERQEFQTALIRLAAWALMFCLLGAGGLLGHYELDWWLFFGLFAVHLVVFLGFLAHVVARPRFMPVRSYLGIVADLSGTTWSIFLSGNPLSPFFLIYIWSFVSQGIRFGRRNLLIAAVGALLAYTATATVLGGWHRFGLETGFVVLALTILPLYQYTLLRKLQAAHQHAEEANQARGKFLATMTHELRTPLSGVVGLSRLLSETDLNREQRECLDSICSAANTLEALIGDILDLSKIDANKLVLKPQYFDLRARLLDVCNTLAGRALDKGVELVCRVDAEVPVEVYGDDLRIRQILFNLISNAVKFTHQGHVCVEARLAGADEDLPQPHLEIAVVDTGIGIARQDLDRIFENFWQADSSTTRQYGGTGLGTAIARDLSVLMGGAIGVESIEGEGSRFWIKLPVMGGPRGVLSPPTPPAGLRGKGVVIVETNDVGRAALVELCIQAGMRVLAKASAKLAAGSLHSEDSSFRPDLLLLADDPRGRDLVGEAMLLGGAAAGAAESIVYLSYPRRRPLFTNTGTWFSVKPFSSPQLWQAMAEALRLGAERDRPGSQSTAERPTRASGRSGHVLVAEDDRINAYLIESLLQRAGYRVTLTKDGRAALAALGRGPFDLALIDLQMPRLDGIGFARELRAREQDGASGAAERRLPVIALTANAADEVRAECLAVGMDEFLMKPINPELLSQLLERYVPA